MQELGVAQEAPEEEDTISMSKEVLADLQRQISELKEAQAAKTPVNDTTGVKPGDIIKVDKNAGEKTKAIYRFREDSESPWQYLIEVKKLKFVVDRDKGYKVNIMKVTTVSEKGDIETVEMTDDELSKILETSMVKISDIKEEDFAYQDATTPYVDAKAVIASQNPNSVTGVDIKSLGRVKNIITFKKKSYTVHINDKVSFREETDGKTVTVLRETIKN